MRKHARLWLVGTVTLGLGAWFVGGARTDAAAGDDALKPTIPEQEVHKLIDQDTKYIEERLAGRMDDKVAKRIRMAAVMIAVYTDSARNGGGAKLAGTRATALKLAAAAKSRKVDEVKKELADLKGGGKPGAGQVPTDLDLEDIMRPFSLSSTGGLGIEKEFLSLNKRPLPKNTMNQKSEQLTLMGYKAATIAQLAKQHPAEAAQKNAGTRKKWATWSDDMYTAAIEFAEAARAKNPMALKTAAVKLNNSCSQCHAEFRTEE
jgi:hypothetical protein